MSNASHTPLSLGQALLHWVIYVVVFVVFGGIGAGITSLVYELLLPEEFSDVLYAVVFGALGFIAYRLALRYLEK